MALEIDFQKYNSLIAKLANREHFNELSGRRDQAALATQLKVIFRDFQ